MYYDGKDSMLLFLVFVATLGCLCRSPPSPRLAAARSRKIASIFHRREMRESNQYLAWRRAFFDALRVWLLRIARSGTRMHYHVENLLTMSLQLDKR